MSTSISLGWRISTDAALGLLDVCAFVLFTYSADVDVQHTQCPCWLCRRRRPAHPVSVLIRDSENTHAIYAVTKLWQTTSEIEFWIAVRTGDTWYIYAYATEGTWVNPFTVQNCSPGLGTINWGQLTWNSSYLYPKRDCTTVGTDKQYRHARRMAECYHQSTYSIKKLSEAVDKTREVTRSNVWLVKEVL